MTVVSFEAAQLRPLAEKVLVQRVAKQRESRLALEHAETMFHPICRVLAVGPAPGNWLEGHAYPDVRVGDLAIVDVYEGDELKEGPTAQEMLMVSVWGLLAVLRPGQKGHKLHALSDHLWVVPEETPELRTPAGVIIAQGARLPSQVARVRSVGPGCLGLAYRWAYPPVKVNDRILMTSKAGKACATGAQVFRLVRFDEVLGVLEPPQEAAAPTG